MKKNILILPVLILALLFTVSCTSFRDALDFSRFGSSARENAESEQNDHFFDDEYTPESTSGTPDDLTDQNEKELDKKEEDKINNSNNGAEPDMNENSFVMRAVIENIEDKITVNVYEAEYAEGIYLINFGESTVFSDSDGNAITVSELKVGDKIEITYNGQVMMSYPPQVAAKMIKKL